MREDLKYVIELQNISAVSAICHNVLNGTKYFLTYYSCSYYSFMIIDIWQSSKYASGESLEIDISDGQLVIRETQLWAQECSDFSKLD